MYSCTRVTHLKESKFALESVHYLWGRRGGGGGGLANRETERLELFVPPSMIKDNFFLPPLPPPPS